jgi:hypothetical protein
VGAQQHARRNNSSKHTGNNDRFHQYKRL